MLHTSKMRVQPIWLPSIGVSIMCWLVDGPAVVVAVHVGTRIRCRELLSGDYSSLLVYASLVGAAAVSRKTVWLKMQITHNVKNDISL